MNASQRKQKNFPLLDSKIEWLLQLEMIIGFSISEIWTNVAKQIHIRALKVYNFPLFNLFNHVRIQLRTVWNMIERLKVPLPTVFEHEISNSSWRRCHATIVNCRANLLKFIAEHKSKARHDANEACVVCLTKPISHISTDRQTDSGVCSMKW